MQTRRFLDPSLDLIDAKFSNLTRNRSMDGGIVYNYTISDLSQLTTNVAIGVDRQKRARLTDRNASDLLVVSCKSRIIIQTTKCRQRAGLGRTPH